MLVTLDQPPPTDVLKRLPPSPIWDHVGPDIRERVLAACDWISIEPGDILINEGESGDCAYYMTSGRLVVVSPGTQDTVEHVNYAGDWVGEIALLTREPRTATVYARRGSVLARLTNAKFDALVAAYPELLVAFSRWTILKLSGKRSLPSPDGVLAIVPASREFPVAQFVDKLRAALGERRSVEVVDAERARTLSGSADSQDSRQAELRARLSAIEADVDWLIVIADERSTAWSQLCQCEADRVLMVAEVGAAPSELATTVAHDESAYGSAQRELVLIHPQSGRLPSGTGRWLKHLKLDKHHNIRMGERTDFARLARFINGTAIGLALAGGAARGFTHLGVLRALEEAKIPIDLVCGTSIGAAAAAFYAMSYDLDKIVEISHKGFVRRNWRLLDVTVPVRSVLAGRSWSDKLIEIFGDTQIEDLWRRFFCVSCSLTDAAPFVHHRGLVRRAVACSSAVPGLLPPVVLNGGLHIDGCVLENLPALRAKEHGAGQVIAVELIPAGDPLFARRESHGSGLLARLRALRTQRPALISDIVMRSLFVAPVYAGAKIRQQVDLFIEPPVSRFHFLEFGAFYDMIEVGYQAAKQALDEWTVEL